MSHLSRRTTVLLTPELHDRLRRAARSRGRSIGDLVREACEVRYGGSTPETRLAAVDAMARLSLPVGTPRQMKRESVPPPEKLGR